LADLGKFGDGTVDVAHKRTEVSSFNKKKKKKKGQPLVEEKGRNGLHGGP